MKIGQELDYRTPGGENVKARVVYVSDSGRFAVLHLPVWLPDKRYFSYDPGYYRVAETVTATGHYITHEECHGTERGAVDAINNIIARECARRASRG